LALDGKQRLGSRFGRYIVGDKVCGTHWRRRVQSWPGHGGDKKKTAFLLGTEIWPQTVKNQTALAQVGLCGGPETSRQIIENEDISFSYITTKFVTVKFPLWAHYSEPV